MKKLALAAGLAACLLPVLFHPAIAQQCRPEMVSGTGTAFPYFVMGPDGVIRSRHSTENAANRAARDSAEIRGDGTQFYLRSLFETRWRDRQGRECDPPNPEPVPPDTMTPPPPDTVPAPPPDTASVAVATDLEIGTDASGHDYARWKGPAGTTWTVTLDGVVTTGTGSGGSNAAGYYWMDFAGTVTGELCVSGGGTPICVTAGGTPPPSPPDTTVTPPPPPGPLPSPGAGWNPPSQSLCADDYGAMSSLSQSGCISNVGAFSNTDGNCAPLACGRLDPGRGLLREYVPMPQKCNDQFAGQPATVPLPSGTTEAWVELVISWSPNWDLTNPNCAGLNPDHKTLLGWLGQSGCGTPRFDFKVGEGGDRIMATVPGFPQCDVITGPLGNVRFPNASALWDGQPHVVRLHWTVGNGQAAVYVEIDGTVRLDYVTATDAAYRTIQRLTGPNNRNLGATTRQFLWWHALRVWVG